MKTPHSISSAEPRVWPCPVFVVAANRLPVPYRLDRLPDYMPVLVVMWVTRRNRNFDTMFSLS